MPTFEEPDVGSLADSNSTLPWQWQHGSALAPLRGLSLGDLGGRWLPDIRKLKDFDWEFLRSGNLMIGRFLRNFCVFQIDWWLLLEVSEHFLWMSVEKTRRAAKHMRLLDLGKFWTTKPPSSHRKWWWSSKGIPPKNRLNIRCRNYTHVPRYTVYLIKSEHWDV